MLKPYKFLVVSGVIFGMFHLGFSQEKETYKDVLLNGKPAKLNIITGEITVVEPAIEQDTSKIKAPFNQKVSQDSINQYHVVQKGETLMDISSDYKVPINTLKRLNNLETTIVNEGQQLIISGNLKAKSSKGHLDAKYDSTSKYHVVQRGETLYSLAKQYDLSLSELKEQNGIKTDLLKEGQKLIISTEDAQEVSVDAKMVIVQKGDTLFSLARQYDTSVAELKRLNNLKDNTIVIGQTLRLR